MGVGFGVVVVAGVVGVVAAVVAVGSRFEGGRIEESTDAAVVVAAACFAVPGLAPFVVRSSAASEAADFAAVGAVVEACCFVAVVENSARRLLAAGACFVVAVAALAKALPEAVTSPFAVAESRLAAAVATDSLLAVVAGLVPAAYSCLVAGLARRRSAGAASPAHPTVAPDYCCAPSSCPTRRLRPSSPSCTSPSPAAQLADCFLLVHSSAYSAVAVRDS